MTFTLCPRCAETLTRAFAGVVYSLSQGHSEKRERWIAKLFDRLERNGFESVHLSLPRNKHRETA